jgi:GalNAc-alpha-(1->4)-GalNAc-alpha-(1->3)-diNAcBac-PP-undecaprenol alpha-1,4-N-acetyl-D-galactosaminyltransferase
LGLLIVRIALLTSSLNLGGAERAASGLCNAWADRGDQVTLIATFSGGGKPFYPISPNVELIFLADVVGVKRVNVLSYLERLHMLRRLLVARRPDLIVSFLPNVNIAAVLSSAFLKIPVIICERSDPPSDHRIHILDVLRRLIYRFADMLTVQTDGVVPKVRSMYPGLKAVHVVPNGLPPEIMFYRKRCAGERKILLSLGRLSAEKQVSKLLDAYFALAPTFKEWDLHIYGDGPERPALERKIREARLEERVLLKGPTSEPWQVMADADAFVLVSRYEGFPNALLEAMGIGLPCVAFDCPSGPRELMRDGEAGRLIALDDRDALVASLKELMGDAPLRSSLGRRAREEVSSRYSFAAVLARWDQLFQHAGVKVARDSSAPAPPKPVVTSQRSPHV